MNQSRKARATSRELTVHASFGIKRKTQGYTRAVYILVSLAFAFREKRERLDISARSPRAILRVIYYNSRRSRRLP